MGVAEKKADERVFFFFPQISKNIYIYIVNEIFGVLPTESSFFVCL